MHEHDSRELMNDTSNLSSLPEVSPPEDAWPTVAARLARERRSKRLPHWIAMASAAMLMVAVGVILMLTTRIDEQQQLQAQNELQLQKQLAGWVAYSQDLEAELRALGEREGVIRGHQAVALGQLEHMVAAVDQQLAQPNPRDRQLALWQRRAVLLNDLVTVKAGNVLQVPGQPPQPVITLNRPAGKARLATYEM
jgi:hypothetical protein